MRVIQPCRAPAGHKHVGSLGVSCCFSCPALASSTSSTVTCSPHIAPSCSCSCQVRQKHCSKLYNASENHQEVAQTPTESLFICQCRAVLFVVTHYRFIGPKSTISKNESGFLSRLSAAKTRKSPFSTVFWPKSVLRGFFRESQTMNSRKSLEIRLFKQCKARINVTTNFSGGDKSSEWIVVKSRRRL